MKWTRQDNINSTSLALHELNPQHLVVRGRDAFGGKMDIMELERENGITIRSAVISDWESTVFRGKKEPMLRKGAGGRDA